MDSGLADAYAALVFTKPIPASPVTTDVSPIHKDEETGLFECADGFDSRFERPASDGGRYVTLDDLLGALSLGTQYTKAKIAGVPYQYDSFLLHPDRLGLSTIPKGTAFYNGAIRYVVTETVSASAFRNNWQRYSTPYSDNGCILSYNGNTWTRIFVDNQPSLPKEETTGIFPLFDVDFSNFAIGVTNPINSCLIALSGEVTCTGTMLGRPTLLTRSICGKGLCRILVSPFADIVTNEEHLASSMIMTILKGQEDEAEQLFGGEVLHMNYIPVSPRQHLYFYAAYVNGKASDLFFYYNEDPEMPWESLTYDYMDGTCISAEAKWSGAQ